MATAELKPQSKMTQERLEPTVNFEEPVKLPKPNIPGELSLAGSMGGPKTPSSSRSATPHQDRGRKIGHRRVDQAGQVTYKKRPTSELMAAIQLGIGQSVGGLASKPERDLLLQDFTIVESVFFPRDGSNLTPAHHYSDFRFKSYAPIAFRYFRELFNIQPDDFLLSMCNEGLQELCNPGASGSIFYISSDDEFIIKTVQHKEAEFLQKLLPGYYMNLNQNPRTLLPKFYGLHCYQCGGKNIRFVVMNNLLPQSIRMHEKYDLKGSTYKRKASGRERKKSSPTLKDLDFVEIHQDGVMLEADTYNALIKTIERDCRVLQSFKIMDYSLLLGIHNLDQAAKEKEQLYDLGGAGTSSADNGTASNTPASADRSRAGVQRGRSVRQRLAQYSTAMEAIQARSEPLELDDEDIPPGGIPARNSKGERLLLFVGLIDILQNYRLGKKLEHAVKSMVHDGDTISVHRPGFYASRFQSFFRDRVFKKIPSLDQPQVKGPHMRFKKLVQLALKHSPSKRKGAAGRARSESEGKTSDRLGVIERQKSYSDADNSKGAVGGRPDLLPANATPPRSLTDDFEREHQLQMLQTSGQKHDWSATSGSHALAYTSHTSTATDTRAGVGASLSLQPSNGEEPQTLSSPAHSYSESTPTHTEYTEGTPSFTTSSPSCSSDMLDSTPQLSVRSGGSRLASHSTTSVNISTEQIDLELLEHAGSVSEPHSVSHVADTTVYSSGAPSHVTTYTHATGFPPPHEGATTFREGAMERRHVETDKPQPERSSQGAVEGQETEDDNILEVTHL